MTATFTETQKRALAVLLKADCALSADDIAARLKYRPARTGRLAVTRSLRSLLRSGTDVGEIIHRLAPADQWACAKWVVHNHEAAGAAIA